MDVRLRGSSAAFSSTREALRSLQAISATERGGCQYYRLDRTAAHLYFAMSSKFPTLIQEYFDQLRAKGEEPVFADICGRADMRNWGVQKNYSFSLQPADGHFNFRKNIAVVGDIFSMKDFYSFVRMLREKGDRPALATFEPVAGLQSYIPYQSRKDVASLYEEVVYQRLINNLRQLVSVVRKGGFIYISRPFAMTDMGFFGRRPLKEYEISKQMAATAKELKCSLRIEGTFCGPVFLLRKRGK